jgi:hypothetical protein
MKRRLEWEYIPSHRTAESGKSYSCTVEGENPILNRLFELLSNHPNIMRVKQWSVDPDRKPKPKDDR